MNTHRDDPSNELIRTETIAERSRLADLLTGLDITEPLGLQPAPPERIRLVLDNVGGKNLAYFGVDLTGRRLVAEDVDLELATGTHEMKMSVSEMLMAMTGRVPLPDLQEATIGCGVWPPGSRALTRGRGPIWDTDSEQIRPE